MSPRPRYSSVHMKEMRGFVREVLEISPYSSFDSVLIQWDEKYGLPMHRDNKKKVKQTLFGIYEAERKKLDGKK